jgi:hypothetical protein
MACVSPVMSAAAIAPSRPRERRADPRRHMRTHCRQHHAPTRGAAAIRRIDEAGRAERIAHRPQPVEEGAPLEIIGARHLRRRRRHQHRLHLEPGAGDCRRIAAAQPHADTRRRRIGREPFDVRGRDHEPRAFGQGIDRFEPPGHRGGHAMRQHRRRHEMGFDLRRCESERQRRERRGERAERPRAHGPSEERERRQQ